MVRTVILFVANSLLVATASSGELEELVKSIRAVGNEARGNVEAGKAVAELGARSAKDIPEILDGFHGASPLAVNYLRSAVESIADRSLKAKASLPADQLEELVHSQKQDPRARRLAFELLIRIDKSAAKRIIPKMLLDPSPEFRRDAVQHHVELAKKAERDKDSKKLYRLALKGATDADQVKEIAKALKDLKVDVDLQTHFGFLTNWKIIGPFDNVDLVGFAKSYPPEKEIDLTKKLEGQKGEVSWSDISTEDEFGIIDIAKSVAPHKGAVMYLTTEFVADSARELQLRFGTPNAWKIWINGEFVFGRDEYHRGMAIDQYTVDVSMKKGKNVVLLKLCQNEQTQDWAQRYQIQFRVCDHSGIAVLSADRRVAEVNANSSNKQLTAKSESAP